jgi:hypothetical protein
MQQQKIGSRCVFSIGCQHYLLLMLAADAEDASAAASSASKNKRDLECPETAIF